MKTLIRDELKTGCVVLITQWKRLSFICTQGRPGARGPTGRHGRRGSRASIT